MASHPTCRTSWSKAAASGALLDETAIPIHADAREMSRLDGKSPLEHALHDGEDFELCAVVPAADATRLLAGPPKGARLFRVGEITERLGSCFVHPPERSNRSLGAVLIIYKTASPDMPVRCI